MAAGRIPRPGPAGECRQGRLGAHHGQHECHLRRRQRRRDRLRRRRRRAALPHRCEHATQGRHADRARDGTPRDRHARSAGCGRRRRRRSSSPTVRSTRRSIPSSSATASSASERFACTGPPGRRRSCDLPPSRSPVRRGSRSASGRPDGTQVTGWCCPTLASSARTSAGPLPAAVGGADGRLGLRRDRHADRAARLRSQRCAQAGRRAGVPAARRQPDAQRRHPLGESERDTRPRDLRRPCRRRHPLRALQDLGRTRPGVLDNTEFDADGTVRHFGTNQIGRYSLHLHHVFGPMRPAAAYISSRSSVTRWTARRSGASPFTTATTGSCGTTSSTTPAVPAIVAEDGSESFNVFEHNFAMRSEGSGDFAPRSGYGGAARSRWGGRGLLAARPQQHHAQQRRRQRRRVRLRPGRGGARHGRAFREPGADTSEEGGYRASTRPPRRCSSSRATRPTAPSRPAWRLAGTAR